jgi:hypothetical protein
MFVRQLTYEAAKRENLKDKEGMHHLVADDA